MKTLNQKIQKHIVKVLNKSIFKEKKKIIRYEGISLYPSEIHLMLFIQNDIDTNATEIARQMGLTKGAVSQTLSRLEKKGILRKAKDPYNKNELTLSLTSFGKRAYDSFQSIQALMAQTHNDYLAKLAVEEKEVILNFLLHMEKVLDDVVA